LNSKATKTFFDLFIKSEIFYLKTFFAFRPQKLGRAAKQHATDAMAAASANEAISFPPDPIVGSAGPSSGKKSGGRIPKVNNKGVAKGGKSAQAGLETETVGFYVDDQVGLLRILKSTISSYLYRLLWILSM